MGTDSIGKPIGKWRFNGDFNKSSWDFMGYIPTNVGIAMPEIIHPFLMVYTTHKMVMNEGWFMTLLYQHYEF